MVSLTDDVEMAAFEGNDSDGNPGRSIPFLLDGPVQFAPTYYPETIRVTKERNLNRSENFCRGEDVSDTGSKNRDIHVTGIMVGEEEKQAFNDLLDSGRTFDMSSTTWSGEVYVSTGDYEGPTGYDARAGAQQYQYTVDLVSTAAQLRGDDSESGIIESPTDADILPIIDDINEQFGFASGPLTEQ